MARTVSRQARLLRRGVPALLVVLLVGTTVALVTLSGDRRAHAEKPHRRREGVVTTTMSPATTSTTSAPVSVPSWRVAWGSAMAWGYGIAENATVRELTRVGIGGRAVRIRISNAFGNAPLVVGAATVALDTSGPYVAAGTLHQVTFAGQPSVTIPVGQVLTSDTVPIQVHAMQVLAVSLYVVRPDLVSLNPSRPDGPKVSYFTPNGGGDAVDAPGAAPFSAASPFPRWVDAVDVLTSRAAGSIVVVGDSITAGFNTSLTWTHVLQNRIDLLPADERRAVVNEGISANTLISVPGDFAKVGGGPPGLQRMDVDALTQDGVSEVVIFLGTNDLYFGATADQVIAGLQQAIAMVHQAGLRVIGVTLLPRKGSVVDGRPWTETMETYREQVNQWIRTSGAFDAVLDFAAAVRDAYNGACVPTAMFPPYDSGDHLHPNPAGQTAMADSVNTTLLDLPQAPTVPLLVGVTPTPGCTGPTGVPTPPPLAAPVYGTTTTTTSAASTSPGPGDVASQGTSSGSTGANQPGRP